MSNEVFELQDWEAWEIPETGGRPAGLRITTDVEMPFEASTLLKARLGLEGFEIEAPDLNITLVLIPRPSAGAVALFERSLAYLLPITFTEVDFPRNRQRTWLATPTRNSQV